MRFRLGRAHTQGAGTRRAPASTPPDVNVDEAMDSVRVRVRVRVRVHATPSCVADQLVVPAVQRSGSKRSRVRRECVTAQSGSPPCLRHRSMPSLAHRRTEQTYRVHEIPHGPYRQPSLAHATPVQPRGGSQTPCLPALQSALAPRETLGAGSIPSHARANRSHRIRDHPVRNIHRAASRRIHHCPAPSPSVALRMQETERSPTDFP